MTAESQSQSIYASAHDALGPDIEHEVRRRMWRRSTVRVLGHLEYGAGSPDQGDLLPGEGQARGSVLSVVDQFIDCMSDQERAGFERTGTLPGWFKPACENAWSRDRWGTDDDGIVPDGDWGPGER